MNDVDMDQIHAAVADARTRCATALGIPADVPGPSGPFCNALLDRYLTSGTARCAHLAARPIQPAMLILPVLQWLCMGCAARICSTVRNVLFDPVEECTCDLCRRYVPADPLTPTVLRIDLWMIMGSACPRCVSAIEQEGGALTVAGGHDG